MLRPSVFPRTCAAGALIVVALCATACSGSGGNTPKSDLTLHALASCRASAVIPPDVSSVTPSATAPPTAVLKIGQAVVFPAPLGSRVRTAGASDGAAGTVVCQSTRGTGAQRRAVILGLATGHVQVAVIAPGSSVVRRALVTVTD